MSGRKPVEDAWTVLNADHFFPSGSLGKEKTLVGGIRLGEVEVGKVKVGEMEVREVAEMGEVEYWLKMKCRNITRKHHLF